MCQRMPYHSQDIPVFNFQIMPHTHTSHAVYVIKFYKLNQTAHCVQCVANSLFIKTDMFGPLKGHYQGVKPITKKSTHNLIQFCIYSAKLYDNIDVRQIKMYHIYNR